MCTQPALTGARPAAYPAPLAAACKRAMPGRAPASRGAVRWTGEVLHASVEGAGVTARRAFTNNPATRCGSPADRDFN